MGSVIEADCFVAYGHWERLSSIYAESVNIVEHLGHFFPNLPKARNAVGLFTCMNGIQNSLDDFEDMCESITSKLNREKPLFIGLYNPTSGKLFRILDDLQRLRDEPVLNVTSFLIARQMFMTFSTLLSKLSPKLLWGHIAHSEAGLITRESLTHATYGLSREHQRLVKNHLITMIYGGVGSVPEAHVFKSYNTYSIRDIALRFVKKHLDKLPMPDFNDQEQLADVAKGIVELGRFGMSEAELTKRFKQAQMSFYHRFFTDQYPHVSNKDGYEITLVDCISESLAVVAGDHAFAGDTYQTALRGNIDSIKGDWKIYEPNSIY